MALAGCSDALAPPQTRAQGLKITVSSGEINARTALPNPVFTRYELSFEGPAGKSHNDVTLENGEKTTTVNLAAGTWTVTAVGYVTIGSGEYAAAEGTETINVLAGTTPPECTITLRASQQAGVNGYFSYTVNYPPDKVTTGTLWIYPFGNNQPEEPTRDNLHSNPSGTIKLPPGYYVMRIQLGDGIHTAGVTEIVHIYSNMETEGKYIFEEDEFIETITLSSIIDTGGVVLNSALIFTYVEKIPYFAVVNPNNTWSLTIPYSENMEPVTIAGSFMWNESSWKSIALNQPIDKGEPFPMNQFILCTKVTNPADSSDANNNPTQGTLRWAIKQANGETDSSIIVINIEGTSPTIELSSSLPEITSDITIIAQKAVTIKREDNNFTGSFFTIKEKGTLTLGGGNNTRITLDGGNKNDPPITATAALITINTGGFYMNENITLQNNTKSNGNGGGVYVDNDGTFTMNGGTISGNTVQPGAFGSVYGGGVYVGSGTFTMNGGIISGNTAKNGGGGVYVGNFNSVFHITGGTVYGNDVDNNLQNTVSSDGSGAALFVSTNAFSGGAQIKYGTLGNWYDILALSVYHRDTTIQVVDGQLYP